MTTRLLLLAATLALGCGGPDLECLTSSDCDRNSVCSAGVCAQQPVHIESSTEPGNGPIVVAPRDAGAPDTAIEFEFECDEAQPGDLVVEEILASVPPGDDGDANGDGVRDAYDDEFVEISNRSDRDVGLRGVELWVNDVAKHRFDVTDCLPANSVVVAFAGGPGADGRRVAGKRFGLGNSGGTVSLRRSDGSVFDFVEYGETVGSWVRRPASSGQFYPHLDVSDSYFSPGTCPDGSRWDGRCQASSEGADAG